MNTPPAATQADLDVFITAAKGCGVADAALVSLLRENGWSERRVYRSLTAYYDAAVGVPVPKRSGPAENAREGFAYLVAFITLGIWATALGQIFYYVIDQWFPDPAAYAMPRYGFGHDLAWQLAAIIIAFPTYLFVQFGIERQIAAKPDSADSGVRKWLTYVALVIAASTCIGDAIWFVQTFISGEISIRFFLRFLTLGIIGGGIFAYYLSTMQTGKSARA